MRRAAWSTSGRTPEADSLTWLMYFAAIAVFAWATIEARSASPPHPRTAGRLSPSVGPDARRLDPAGSVRATFHE